VASMRKTAAGAERRCTRQRMIGTLFIGMRLDDVQARQLTA
jgi:hypothetical protein